MFPTQSHPSFFMGTRHITMVVLNDEVVIAQYGQWDGYPDGQGETISKFIREKYDYAKFVNGLKKIKPLTEEIISDLHTQAQIFRNDGYLNTDEAKRLYAIVPELNRDTGAEILEMIQDGKVKYHDNAKDFIDDTLFCEWAYILYLDTEELEVYGNDLGTTQKPKYKTDNPFLYRFKFSELTKESMSMLADWCNSGNIDLGLFKILL